MNLDKRIGINIVAVILAVMLAAVSTLGQNNTLRGQVVDELDGIIPDAEITLIGSDGKERKTRSDGKGNFSIPNVQAGVYTLTSSFKGFQTHVLSELKVPVAAGAFKITMNVASVNVETNISSENSGVSLENDQNMNATILGEAFIKGLPDNEEELREYLNALAGPTANAGGGGGAQIMVDGFSGGKLPPKEAIQQIRVNSNPFSSEYSRGMGFGRIEILTKPGYADWRGSGYWNYANSAVNARNAFALTRPDLSTNRFGFDLGGPVIRKKMSVFMNVHRSMDDGSSVTRWRDSSAQEFNLNVPYDTRSTNVFLNTDYLVNDRNTLKVSYDFRKSSNINSEFANQSGGGGGFFGGGGGGGFGGGGASTGSNRMPGTGSSSYSTSNTLRIGDTWIVNPRMIHEARFELDRTSSNRRALTDGMSIRVPGYFIGGGSTCCPNSSENTEYEFQDYLTYTSRGSKHTIKGGIQLTYETVYDLSNSNSNGTYTFPSIASYNSGIGQLTWSEGKGTVDYGMFQGGWFINEDWKVRDNLQLAFGLRHEFQTYLDDKMNFAPRLGVTWSPFKNRKTVIRAGGGIFFDRLNNNQYANKLRFDGSNQKSLRIDDANYAQDINLEQAQSLNNDKIINNKAQNTTYRFGSNLKAPYDINSMISVEQQLPKGLVANITWMHSKGVNQFRYRNINAPIFNGLFFDEAAAYDYPEGKTAGNINLLESRADSKTDRFSFGMNKRMGKVMIFGNYSLSWIKTNGEGTPANNYDLSAEWGRSSGDSRHFFFTGIMMSLPKGFQLNTNMMARSGTPFNITLGEDFNNDGTLNNDRFIHPLTGQYLPRNSDLTPDYYKRGQFTSCLETKPDCLKYIRLQALMLANYPDGVKAQGPGFFNADMTLSKTFGFGKSKDTASTEGGGRGGPGGGGGGGGRGGGGGGGMVMRGGGGGMMMGGGGSENSRFNLTFQMRVSNVFNRVNESNYQGTIGSPYFKKSSSSREARSFSFSTRFRF